MAARTKKLARFVLFGSFVTDKPEPNDLDIVLIMADDFDAKSVTGEMKQLFEHGAAQLYLGASIFWYPTSAALSPGMLPLERWQIKRDQTRRGIIEIIGE